jgi:hydrogenase nickel incorporation protein HypB
MASKVIEIHEDVYADNNASADALRNLLKQNGTFMINVMSSPGSGKTTTLSKLINMMKDDINIALMDVDIETSIDADTVEKNTGVKTLQINNGGLCHIDADMTTRSIAEFDIKGIDLLVLENIGNLVCPAEFDTGAHKNIMLLSVPEGDDKPLKYPLMFSKCDLVLINKIDTLDFFDFDVDKAKERILALNPNAKIIPVSGKTGLGMNEVVEWLKSEIKQFKEPKMTDEEKERLIRKYERKIRTGADIDMLREKNDRKKNENPKNLCDTHWDGA